ncbi:MAG: DUF1543 domain-containing protein [Gammaproteobacteria bacterium]
MHQLFAIYIGGAHEKSLIELHDMRFVIADSIENTYDSLRKSWWGIPKSLHLDAWGMLKQADGYNIQVKDHPPVATEHRLYFVNLGGYDDTLFTELHRNVFVVAKNRDEAKARAKQLIMDWQSPHQDYQYEAENIIDVDETMSSEHHYLHLTPSKDIIPFEFTCLYTPIG